MQRKKRNIRNKTGRITRDFRGKTGQLATSGGNRGYVILGLGLVGSILLILLEKETQKEEMKKKKKQMLNEEEELLDELDRSSEDEREQP